MSGGGGEVPLGGGGGGGGEGGGYSMPFFRKSESILLGVMIFDPSLSGEHASSSCASELNSDHHMQARQLVSMASSCDSPCDGVE